MNGVWGTVNYLAPGSTRNRLYVAPGEQRATARYEPHQVFVADGRPCQDDLTLEESGFTLVRHRTSVPGLDNPAVLDGAYTGEGIGLVRALTGADHVVSLGWLTRRTTAARRGALPPAPDVHVDLHTTEIAHRYARVHARSALPAPGTYRRAVWTSLWRAFSPPPQDWPLALCDYRSTDDAEDGAPNLLFRVPALPGSDAEYTPDDEAESAASLFCYNPAHRWWYFPGMHAGEALLIKLHDTDHRVAWRAPHTSFRDNAAGGAHPRESVERRPAPYFRLQPASAGRPGRSTMEPRLPGPAHRWRPRRNDPHRF